jgi:hypothetical protein
MRCPFVALTMLLAVAFQLTGKPNHNASQGKSSPNEERSIAIALINYAAPQAETGSTQQQTPQWYASVEWANWALVIVGIFTLCGIWYQARETARAAAKTAESVEAINRQAVIMERQTAAAEQAAQAAILNAKALIASERAWIDGEVVLDEKLKKMAIERYSVYVTNYGKTPAQIRSYRINSGPLVEGTPFSPARLPGHTQRLEIFLGASERRLLLENINMEDMFPSDRNGTEIGAYCVTVIYADVVAGTPEKREEHETFFVYRYGLLGSFWRIAGESRYT